jgi:hypothetical protein
MPTGLYPHTLKTKTKSCHTEDDLSTKLKASKKRRCSVFGLSRRYFDASCPVWFFGAGAGGCV